MDEQPLSEQGELRRRQILQLAKAEARHRRRKRFALRGVAVVALAFTMIPAILRMQPRHMPTINLPQIARLSPAVLPPAPSITIEYVQTDPTITDRLTIKPQPPRWTTIGDDEFLKELADAGQPAGIAYINGKAILLPRAETR